MSISRHPLLGNVILTKILIFNLLRIEMIRSSLMLNTPAAYSEVQNSLLFWARLWAAFIEPLIVLIRPQRDHD